MMEFKNNKGEVIQFSENDTIADLVRLGVIDIALVKQDAPLPDNWYRDVVAKQETTATTNDNQYGQPETQIRSPHQAST